MITPNQFKNRINEIASNSKKIDVVKLAKDLGIKVFLAENGKDFNAEIVYDDKLGEFEIFVNAKHPYTRQRFSIAHELGHFILHRDLIMSQKKVSRAQKDTKNYQIEKAADKMAEEILMPEILVEEVALEFGLDKSNEITSDLISQIANKFDVSNIMAAIRLQNLGYVVSLSYVA